MVEVPLRQPNWLGSMMCSTSSISHSTTKSSKTLETIAVREIGLKSPIPVMGVTLGTGVTLESFHAVVCAQHFELFEIYNPHFTTKFSVPSW